MRTEEFEAKIDTCEIVIGITVVAEIADDDRPFTVDCDSIHYRKTEGVAAIHFNSLNYAGIKLPSGKTIPADLSDRDHFRELSQLAKELFPDYADEIAQQVERQYQGLADVAA